MFVRVLLLFLFPLLLASGAGAQSKSKVKKCEARRGWSHEDCLRVSQHHAWVGMTEDMALAALGKPKLQVTRGGEKQLTFKRVRMNGGPSDSPFLVGTETIILHIATEGCSGPSDCRVIGIEQN